MMVKGHRVGARFEKVRSWKFFMQVKSTTANSDVKMACCLSGTSGTRLRGRVYQMSFRNL